eukprot:Rhum_TRINITY_DN14737_c24_g1::Rhum_TRINITY_DN14737_c24_g1_i3::g.113761::m.113761
MLVCVCVCVCVPGLVAGCHRRRWHASGDAGKRELATVGFLQHLDDTLPRRQTNQPVVLRNKAGADAQRLEDVKQPVGRGVRRDADGRGVQVRRDVELLESALGLLVCHLVKEHLGGLVDGPLQLGGVQQGGDERRTADEADDAHVGVRHDDGEARVVAAVQQVVHVLHRPPHDGDHLDVARRHEVRRRRVETHLLLRVQVGVPVQLDVRLVNAVDAADPLSDPLADQDCEHDRHQVLQPTRQLEHDHHKRQRHPRHAAQHGCGAHDRVHPRDDAEGVDVRALGEDVRVGGGVMQLARQDAGRAPQAGADKERGDEEACRHLHAEGEDGEDKLDGGRQEQRRHVVLPAHGLLRLRLLLRAAVLEQPRDELPGTPVHVRHNEVQGRCRRRHQAHLGHGPVPEHCRPTDPTPPQVQVDEHGTDHAAEDSEERVGDQLEPVPLVVVPHLEEHEPSRAGGVNPLQHQGRHDGAEEGAPHRLVREVVRRLLQREEHAADGRAEGHADARGDGGGDDLALLRLVRAVALEQLRRDVAHAGRDVHERALHAQGQPGADGQRDAQALDEQGPLVEVALDVHTGEDGLDLGDAG